MHADDILASSGDEPSNLIDDNSTIMGLRASSNNNESNKRTYAEVVHGMANLSAELSDSNPTDNIPVAIEVDQPAPAKKKQNSIPQNFKNSPNFTQPRKRQPNQTKKSYTKYRKVAPGTSSQRQPAPVPLMDILIPPPPPFPQTTESKAIIMLNTRPTYSVIDLNEIVATAILNKSKFIANTLIGSPPLITLTRKVNDNLHLTAEIGVHSVIPMETPPFHTPPGFLPMENGKVRAQHKAIDWYRLRNIISRSLPGIVTSIAKKRRYITVAAASNYCCQRIYSYQMKDFIQFPSLGELIWVEQVRIQQDSLKGTSYILPPNPILSLGSEEPIQGAYSITKVSPIFFHNYWPTVTPSNDIRQYKRWEAVAAALCQARHTHKTNSSIRTPLNLTLQTTDVPSKFKSTVSIQSENAMTAVLKIWKEGLTFSLSQNNDYVVANGVVTRFIPNSVDNTIELEAEMWHSANIDPKCWDDVKLDFSVNIHKAVSTAKSNLNGQFLTYSYNAITRALQSKSVQGEILRQTITNNFAQREANSIMEFDLHPKIMEKTLEAQQRSIQLIVDTEQPLLVLQQAPAGSGKTLVVGMGVAELLHRKEFGILVTAPTNVAVINLVVASISCIKEVIGEVADDMMMVITSTTAAYKMKTDEVDVSDWIKYSVPNWIDALKSTDLFKKVAKSTQNALLRYQELKRGDSLRPAGEEAALKFTMKHNYPPVIFATTAMAEPLLQHFGRTKFLLIDEAGQLPALSFLKIVAELPQLEKAFITGDRFQLGAFQGDLPPHLAPLSIIDLLETSKGAVLNTLNASYRFHPTYAKLLEVIYPCLTPMTQLKDRSLLTDSPINLPMESIPFIVIHMSEADSKDARHSRLNPAQTTLVSQIAHNLLQAIPTLDLDIITLYQAQLAELKNIPEKCTVWTIDAFQGRQSSLPILVTTRSEGAVDYQSDKRYDFPLSSRRAVASITRGQNGLILVMDCNLFAMGEIWGKFLRELVKLCPIFTSDYAHLMLGSPLRDQQGVLVDPISGKSPFAEIELNQKWTST